MNRIYYLIPDIPIRKKWSFIIAFKSLLKAQFLDYIKSCLVIKEKPVGGIKVIF
ncbi:hypothetical protein LCGC14_2262670, partial [marine sediment metagenome]